MVEIKEPFECKYEKDCRLFLNNQCKSMPRDKNDEPLCPLYEARKYFDELARLVGLLMKQIGI